MHDFPFNLVSTLLLILFIIFLGGITLYLLRKKNKQSPALKTPLTPNQTEDWLIYYASQRGRAKEIAEKTVLILESAGKDVSLIKLSDTKPSDLTDKTYCLFITSTFGSGQAPEAARGFERKLKKTRLNINQMNFAVLALGDQQYDRFCGFGKTLNQWLIENNATPIQPLITVNQMNQESINYWQNTMQKLAENK